MTGAAMDFLLLRYPKCFDLTNPQPLKVGIDNDIFTSIPLEVSRNALRNALDAYTRGPDYLKGVTVGRARIDLEGAQAGTVTPDEATYALKRFELAQPPLGTKSTAPAPSPPPSAPAAKKPTLTLKKT